MANPTLSIIVPVYNAETYLRRCLDSILAQTYTDFEVICINDGSSDKSSEILEEYASKDSRVIIINQANKGAGAARNAGLKIMRGTYVGFVDADDWIEPQMYSYMIQKLIENEVDSVVCGFKLEGDVKSDALAQKAFEYFISHKIIKFDINYNNLDKIPIFVCKLLKVEIIKKYNLEFPEGIVYEDQSFTWFYMSLSKNTMFLNAENEIFYHYFKHGSSLSATSKLYTQILDLFTSVEKFLEHALKHNILKEFEPAILSYFMLFYNKVINIVKVEYKFEFISKASLFLQFIDLDLCFKSDLEIEDYDIKFLIALKKLKVYYLSKKTKNINFSVDKFLK